MLLKSQRGEAVGAVQIALSLTRLGGRLLDPCPSAPPPLAEAPQAILALLLSGATFQQLLSGQAPRLRHQLLSSSPSRSPPPSRQEGRVVVEYRALPNGFEGQWSRLTLHIDQLVIPSPGAAAELRPK